MRLTTIFKYVAVCATAAYFVALFSEEENDEVEVFEADDDDPKWTVIDAEPVEVVDS